VHAAPLRYRYAEHDYRHLEWRDDDIAFLD
jgi:hypothetical protein